MFRKFIGVVGAIFVVFAANYSALAQISDMKKVYPTFEVLTVAGILTEAGVSYQISQLEDGTPLITAQVGQGKTVIMLPTRCQVANSSTCYSLIFMSFGRADQLPFSTLAENLAVVNSLNEWLDLAKVYISATSDMPTVTSFLNSDHGVSKGNIVATLSLLIQSSDYFFGELAQAKESSNTLSSKSLNEAPTVSTLFPGGKEPDLLSPSQEGTDGGVTKSLLQNRAFQALLATEDFQRDFTYQVSD